MLIVETGGIIGGGLIEQLREMASRSMGMSKVPSRLMTGGSGIGMLVYGMQLVAKRSGDGVCWLCDMYTGIWR